MNVHARITFAATVLAAAVASPMSTAYAIGPTLPLSFEDQADQKNRSGLLPQVDPRQVRDVRVERQILILASEGFSGASRRRPSSFYFA